MKNDRVYRDLFDLCLQFQTQFVDYYYNSYKNDMTYLQCRVFDHICNEEGISAKELAVFFGLPKQHISLILEKLEKDGWVTRQRSDADRRCFRILLTETGKRYYADHLKAAYNHYVRIRKRMTDEEYICFSEHITDLKRLFEKAAFSE